MKETHSNYWGIISKKNLINKLLEMILIFGVIAILIIGGILFRRYKIIKHNLKYEMNEEPEL